MEFIAKSEVFKDIKLKSREKRNYVFSVCYVRFDGTVGRKHKVMKVYVGNDNAIVNRTVNLCDVTNGKAFRIAVDFWVSYNNKVIKHEQ